MYNIIRTISETHKPEAEIIAALCVDGTMEWHKMTIKPNYIQERLEKLRLDPLIIEGSLQESIERRAARIMRADEKRAAKRRQGEQNAQNEAKKPTKFDIRDSGVSTEHRDSGVEHTAPRNDAPTSAEYDFQSIGFVDTIPGSVLTTANYWPVSRNKFRECVAGLKLAGYYRAMVALWCRIATDVKFVQFLLDEDVLGLYFDPEIDDDDELEIDKNKISTPAYMELIHYGLFYMMVILNNEEHMLKAFRYVDRVVVPAAVVAKLPQYVGPTSDCPYLPVPYSDRFMMDLPKMIDTSKRGIYNQRGFELRFNIVTRGVLTGIDWNNIAVSGSSVLVALYNSPLERAFGIDFEAAQADPDQYWADSLNVRAFEEYLGNYYWDKRHLVSNLTYKSDVEVYDLENRMGDIDIIVDAGTDEEFDVMVAKIYEHIRVGWPDVGMSKITQISKYKFRISGKSLMRHIEIFRTGRAGIVSGVMKFHYPCVRNIYDGRNVYMGATSIFSAMTGILTDRRWMIAAKNPEDVLLKYMLRGFAPVLNSVEREFMLRHIAKQRYSWAELLDYNSDAFRKSRKPQDVKQEYVTKWVNHTPSGLSQAVSHISRLDNGHVEPPRFWEIVKKIAELRQ